MSIKSFMIPKKLYKSLSDEYDSANNFEYVQSFKK
jgi:hypothetical protein